jgi:hypothetical protein
LWTINFHWLRWSLIVVSIALSGFVLGSTILDAFKADKNKVLVLGLVCGVVVLHAGLAIGMKVNKKFYIIFNSDKFLGILL